MHDEAHPKTLGKIGALATKVLGRSWAELRSVARRLVANAAPHKSDDGPAQLRIQYQQAYAGLFSSKYGGGYTTFIHHSDLRKVGVPLLSSSIHFPFPYFSSTFGVQRRVSVIPFNRVYYDVPRMDPFKMRPFVLMTAHKEPLEPVEESDDPTSRGPAPKKPMFRKNAGPA